MYAAVLQLLFSSFSWGRWDTVGCYNSSPHKKVENHCLVETLSKYDLIYSQMSVRLESPHQNRQPVPRKTRVTIAFLPNGIYDRYEWVYLSVSSGTVFHFR